MIKNKSTSHLHYFKNNGEMGELILNFNWANTPLGPIEFWSKGLLTTVGIMLNAKIPMLLWWGEELIQLYNDAYRIILGYEGKHPEALGQNAKYCWSDIWPVIGPLVDQVKNTGEATWQEDALIPILRNGRVEDIYWTYSYSQVIDEEKVGAGIFVTCFETTQKVNTQKIINKSLKELAAYKSRMNNLIAQAPVAIGLLEGRDFTIVTANAKLIQFWGKTISVIGKPLIEALPELKDQAFLNILAEVYTTGKTYNSSEYLTRIEHQGIIKEFYFDFSYQKIKGKNNEKDSILVIAIDVTDQVNARHLIEQSSLQFRQLADSITQMVWITDAQGMHEYYNKRWFDFTGADFETSKGTGWNQMFHPDDRARANEKFEHCLKTGELYEIEYRLRNFRGDYVWFLGRAAPFLNSKGVIIKWFGTCTDINEQKLLLDQKDEFINIASHELKTPLTTFKAYMQLIERKNKEDLPDSLKNLIDNASRSANKIYELVEDLLDVSNLNQRGLTINKSDFSINAIIEECCKNLTIDGNFNIKIIQEEEIEVFADKNQIQRVIINFVNNAIKYAPKSKEIIVKVELENSYVKVAVIDQGEGIAQDKLPELFKRYYRIENTSGQSGLGLGLYICAEIIKKHGGQIGAESELGEGATFWFTLPKI